MIGSFRRHILCKIMALTVCFTFIWQSIGPAAEAESVYKASLSSGSRNIDIASIKVPVSFGEVIDSSKGSIDKTVIHIRDAHCDYSAQGSISGLIGYFRDTYGVDLVALEGGSGDYDLSVFTDIKDGELREKVADYFVQQGEVNGAEFYAINNPAKVTLYGIEEPALYVENLSAYRDSLKFKDKAVTILKSMAEDISKQKDRIYPSDFRELDKKMRLFKEDKIGFEEYAAAIAAYAKKNNIDMSEYPNISRFYEAVDSENGVNMKEAERERNILIDLLNKRLSKKYLEELVAKTVAFNDNEISASEYYPYLLAKAELCGIELDKMPNLIKYTHTAKKINNVNKKALEREFRALEERICSSFLKTDEQRSLYGLDKKVFMLDRLFSVGLVKDDWDYYIAHRNEFDTKEFASLNGYRLDMEKFYNLSLKRDDLFINNITGKLKKEKQKNIILVTGGFHQDNLKKLFQDKGYSYVEVLPRIEKQDGENPYFRLLSGGMDPITKAISEKQSSLQIASYLSKELNLPDRDPEAFGKAARVVEELIRKQESIEGNIRFSLSPFDGSELLKVNGEQVMVDDRPVYVSKGFAKPAAPKSAAPKPAAPEPISPKPIAPVAPATFVNVVESLHRSDEELKSSVSKSLVEQGFPDKRIEPLTEAVTHQTTFPALAVGYTRYKRSKDQRGIIEEDFIKLIREKKIDKSFVMLVVGLGAPPNELKATIEIFYRALLREKENPAKWKVTIYAIDTDARALPLSKQESLSHNFTKEIEAVEVDGRNLRSYSPNLQIYPVRVSIFDKYGLKELIRHGVPPDYIFMRNVLYITPRAEVGDTLFEEVDNLKMYTALSNVYSISKPSTRLVIESTTGMIKPGHRGLSDFVVKGASLMQSGMGILVIEDPGAFPRTLREFNHDLDNELTTQTERRNNGVVQQLPPTPKVPPAPAAPAGTVTVARATNTIDAIKAYARESNVPKAITPALEQNMLTIFKAVKEGRHSTLYYPACANDILRPLLAYDADHMIAVDIIRDNIRIESELKDLGISYEKEEKDIATTLVFALGGKTRRVTIVIDDAKNVKISDYLPDGRNEADIVHIYYATSAEDIATAKFNYDLVARGGFFCGDEQSLTGARQPAPKSILDILGLREIHIYKRHPLLASAGGYTFGRKVRIVQKGEESGFIYQKEKIVSPESLKAGLEFLRLCGMIEDLDLGSLERGDPVGIDLDYYNGMNEALKNAGLELKSAGADGNIVENAILEEWGHIRSRLSKIQKDYKTALLLLTEFSEGRIGEERLRQVACLSNYLRQKEPVGREEVESAMRKFASLDLSRLASRIRVIPKGPPRIRVLPKEPPAAQPPPPAAPASPSAFVAVPSVEPGGKGTIPVLKALYRLWYGWRHGLSGPALDRAVEDAYDFKWGPRIEEGIFTAGALGLALYYHSSLILGISAIAFIVGHQLWSLGFKQRMQFLGTPALITILNTGLQILVSFPLLVQAAPIVQFVAVGVIWYVASIVHLQVNLFSAKRGGWMSLFKELAMGAVIIGVLGIGLTSSKITSTGATQIPVQPSIAVEVQKEVPAPIKIKVEAEIKAEMEEPPTDAMNAAPVTPAVPAIASPAVIEEPIPGPETVALPAPQTPEGGGSWFRNEGWMRNAWVTETVISFGLGVLVYGLLTLLGLHDYASLAGLALAPPAIFALGHVFNPAYDRNIVTKLTIAKLAIGGIVVALGLWNIWFAPAAIVLAIPLAFYHKGLNLSAAPAAPVAQLQLPPTDDVIPILAKTLRSGNITICLDKEGIAENIYNIAMKNELDIYFAGGIARRMLFGKNPIAKGADVDIFVRFAKAKYNDMGEFILNPEQIDKIARFEEEAKKKYPQLSIEIINVDLQEGTGKKAYGQMRNRVLTVDRMLVGKNANNEWIVSDETGGSKECLNNARTKRLVLTSDGVLDYESVLRFVRVVAEFPEAQIDGSSLDEINKFVNSGSYETEWREVAIEKMINDLINGDEDMLSRRMTPPLKTLLKIFMHASEKVDVIERLKEIGGPERNLATIYGRILDLNKAIDIARRGGGQSGNFSDFDSAFIEEFRNNIFAKQHTSDGIIELLAQKLGGNMQNAISDFGEDNVKNFIKTEHAECLELINNSFIADRMIKNYFLVAIWRYEILGRNFGINWLPRLKGVVSDEFYKHISVNKEKIESGIKSGVYKNLLDYYFREYVPQFAESQPPAALVAAHAIQPTTPAAPVAAPAPQAAPVISAVTPVSGPTAAHERTDTTRRAAVNRVVDAIKSHKDLKDNVERIAQKIRNGEELNREDENVLKTIRQRLERRNSFVTLSRKVHTGDRVATFSQQNIKFLNSKLSALQNDEVIGERQRVLAKLLIKHGLIKTKDKGTLLVSYKQDKFVIRRDVISRFGDKEVMRRLDEVSKELAETMNAYIEDKNKELKNAFGAYYGLSEIVSASTDEARILADIQALQASKIARRRTDEGQAVYGAVFSQDEFNSLIKMAQKIKEKDLELKQGELPPIKEMESVRGRPEKGLKGREKNIKKYLDIIDLFDYPKDWSARPDKRETDKNRILRLLEILENVGARAPPDETAAKAAAEAIEEALSILETNTKNSEITSGNAFHYYAFEESKKKKGVIPQTPGRMVSADAIGFWANIQKNLAQACENYIAGKSVVDESLVADDKVKEMMKENVNELVRMLGDNAVRISGKMLIYQEGGDEIAFFVPNNFDLARLVNDRIGVRLMVAEIDYGDPERPEDIEFALGYTEVTHASYGDAYMSSQVFDNKAKDLEKLGIRAVVSEEIDTQSKPKIVVYRRKGDSVVRESYEEAIKPAPERPAAHVAIPISEYMPGSEVPQMLKKVQDEFPKAYEKYIEACSNLNRRDIASAKRIISDFMSASLNSKLRKSVGIDAKTAKYLNKIYLKIAGAEFGFDIRDFERAKDMKEFFNSLNENDAAQYFAWMINILEREIANRSEEARYGDDEKAVIFSSGRHVDNAVECLRRGGISEGETLKGIWISFVRGRWAKYTGRYPVSFGFRKNAITGNGMGLYGGELLVTRGENGYLDPTKRVKFLSVDGLAEIVFESEKIRDEFMDRLKSEEISIPKAVKLLIAPRKTALTDEQLTTMLKAVMPPSQAATAAPAAKPPQTQLAEPVVVHRLDTGQTETITGPALIEASIGPCYVVIIHNKNKGRTYAAHSTAFIEGMIDPDVEGQIDIATSERGEDDNITVVVSGTQVISEDEKDTAEAVLALRKKIVDYLKEKGYTNIRTEFPDHIDTGTNIYFDTAKGTYTVEPIIEGAGKGITIEDYIKPPAISPYMTKAGKILTVAKKEVACNLTGPEVSYAQRKETILSTGQERKELTALLFGNLCDGKPIEINVFGATPTDKNANSHSVLETSSDLTRQMVQARRYANEESIIGKGNISISHTIGVEAAKKKIEDMLSQEVTKERSFTAISASVLDKLEKDDKFKGKFGKGVKEFLEERTMLSIMEDAKGNDIYLMPYLEATILGLARINLVDQLAKSNTLESQGAKDAISAYARAMKLIVNLQNIDFETELRDAAGQDPFSFFKDYIFRMKLPPCMPADLNELQNVINAMTEAWRSL